MPCNIPAYWFANTFIDVMLEEYFNSKCNIEFLLLTTGG